MKTILEFIANKKPTAPKVKYHPQSKKELIESIKTELNAGNYDLNCIDTSNITDMACLFCPDLAEWGRYLDYDLADINFDISGWDVSKVKTMFCMFDGCRKFDCDLSNWDIRNVKYMESMFEQCREFSGNGLDKWHFNENVTVYDMFSNCPKLNAIYGITPEIKNGKLVKK